MPLASRDIVALFVLGAILAMALDGHGPQISPAAARADVTRANAADAGTHQGGPTPGAAAVGGPSSCPMVPRATGYLNPLAGATVKPERIDQGVDYAGSGTLTAIGAARVSNVATDNTGWPGTFIEYQLLTGPDAACYVFYAEGVTPAPGLKVGDVVSPGQVIATIIPQYPTGIEIGWSAGEGTKTYAALTGRWSAADDQDNVASGPGKNFSALIAALGGPPGKVEG